MDASAIEADVFGDNVDPIDAELAGMTVEEIQNRTRALDNEILMFKRNINDLKFRTQEQSEHVRSNVEKVLRACPILHSTWMYIENLTDPHFSTPSPSTSSSSSSTTTALRSTLTGEAEQAAAVPGGQRD